MKSKNEYNELKKIAKFITTIISWTILVILIIFALFLAYYLIGSKISEKNNGKFEPFISLYTIISPSMTPNINVGDVVVAKKVSSPSEIKVGDVITFISTSSVSRGMTITHRVIEISSDDTGVTYVTKGDNNLSSDSAPAKYDNVIGKVIFHVPKLGMVQNFLANRGGWLVVILIPALFIIITDVLKIFKLANVKNKIDKIDQSEKKNKEQKVKHEEIRKDLLKKKLKLEKNQNEPDPIEIYKGVRIVVADNPKILKKTRNSNSTTRVKKYRNKR